jgi:hypothetical protein
MGVKPLGETGAVPKFSGTTEFEDFTDWDSTAVTKDKIVI